MAKLIYIKGGIYHLTEKRNRFIRLTAAISTSAMLVITGILYIISCIEIWRSGTSPFTRDSIGDALMRLIIPSAITVVFIIASAVLFVIFPVKEKRKTTVDTKDARDILLRKIPLTECSMARGNQIVTERNMRAFLRIGGAVLLLMSLVYPIIYLATPENFGVADVNTDVLLAALHIIVSLIPVTAYAIISSYMIRSSYGREAELLRGGIKERGAVFEDGLYDKENAEAKPITAIFDGFGEFIKKNGKVILTVTRCAVLVIGVVFVIAGIFNGGMQDVLDKAVKICRECIGLG